jgi:arsenate reductase
MQSKRLNCMSKFILIHNPRCSKSRKALEFLTDHKIVPEVIEYLKEPLKKEFLEEMFLALEKKPSEVLRLKEDEFKSLSLDLSDDESVIDAIMEFPKILERPIIIKGNKAVIGRPTENINELL